MSGVNKVLLLGNLGADPEFKRTNSGISICNLRVATSKSWKSADGEKHEKTAWHRVVVFKALAELCSKYLTKGSKVFIEGEIEYREYEKDGVKKYSTEILAQNIQFLDKRGEASDIPAALDPQFSPQGDAAARKIKNLPNSAPGAELSFDDIPF